jgi:serine/threonine protein kinase
MVGGPTPAARSAASRELALSRWVRNLLLHRLMPPAPLLRLVKHDPSKDALPRPFGQYLLLEQIGAGGTARVYRARRHSIYGFTRQVVVKTMLPERARDPRFVHLFTEEARISAQLIHANIVQVIDFGTVGGTAFLEMEYLPGINVSQLISAVVERGVRLPVSVVLAIATEACRGLAYAHSFVDENGAHRPIIHRDVSPANVMIGRDGSVKLLDFGLASLTRGETLSIDTFRGKLAYMSPEQAQARRVDRRADVYAFGVMLYELLTGERLFQGENDEETVRRVCSMNVPRPSRRNGEVPAALDAVVLRALERDPEQRYPSADELLTVLEAVTSRAATRKELLAYLGRLLPQVFTKPCDSCGDLIPHGSECSNCRTVLDQFPEELSAPILLSDAPIQLRPPPLISPELLRQLRRTAGRAAGGALSAARWMWARARVRLDDAARLLHQNILRLQRRLRS